MRRLRAYFLTGLLTLLPIWLVWIVFKFVLGLLKDMSQPVVAPLSARLATTHPDWLGWVDDPWAQSTFAIAATVVVIIAVGALARRVAGQQMLRWFEGLIARVPLASTVYGSARKLLDLLQTKPDGTQRVVLIDFPHREMKCVGFVTRVIREEGSGRELAAVYVPTTPNPTSGYLEIVPVDKLTPTDWSVDEAMAFIISGGAVSPETMPFDRPKPARD
ncbi:membrane protein [Arenimonas soli]|uniref:Membrane protein n=1 Tax=Arenimonas soli TaxID=2269504 RepID=A0ABQ1HHP8_9GAMM|nr:DUF502 domain-containing protein [Arenimonas soli]GGA78093.1 membrane protein [Arenimonas soli]